MHIIVLGRVGSTLLDYEVTHHLLGKQALRKSLICSSLGAGSLFYGHDHFSDRTAKPV